MTARVPRTSFCAAALLPIAVLVGCGGGTLSTTVDAANAGIDAATLPTTDAGGHVPGPDAGQGVPREDAGFVPPPDSGPETPAVSPRVAGCDLFPADNPWNMPIDRAPLHPRSGAFLAAMSPTTTLHPDWGNASTDHYGIPWTAGSGAPPVAFSWTARWGNDQSDVRACTEGGGQFCYPIPTSAPIEGGPSARTTADRHILFLDTTGAPAHCTLYEIYNAQNFASPPWRAANGAVFPLDTNALRPEGWTSADAAGLPILPGLVRVDEVLAGEIRHAIRFTMEATARAYIHPATHQAGTDGTDLPPMGLRVRLRASYDTSRVTGPALVILRAMKIYGLMLADNGSDWYLTGDSDDRWDPIMEEIIDALGAVHGSDFEVVDTGSIIGG